VLDLYSDLANQSNLITI